MVDSHSLPRNAAKVLIGVVLGSLLALANPVRAELTPGVVAPGDGVSLTCETGWESVNVTRTEVLAQCTAVQTASPTASATATPSPVPTATSAPSTPPPTPTPSPTSAPTPTPPTPSPSTQPSTSCATIKGYGSGATGGSNLVTVSTVAELRNAAKAGNHVRMTSGTYAVNGRLDLPSNFTLEAAPGHKAIIRGGLFIKAQSNIILRNLAIRADDEWGSAGDLDALTINGLNGSSNRIAISNIEAIWGPDIGGLAVLGDVNDVTVQCSILGEGLRFSDHHEGGPPDGHSMGLSVFQLNTGTDPADRLTFWGNLVTTSDRRMPVIHGARLVDWVNNASYNFGRNAPDGNPRSLNYVGNLVKSGPISTAGEAVWRSRPHSANPCCYANSVWISGNLAAGMPYREDLASGVRASGPFPLSVTPFPAGNVQSFIVANAGPLIRDATDQRLIDNFVNGTGGFVDAD